MEKFLSKKHNFVLKILMLFFMSIMFLFVSCGKDKTIEKIIYGDPGNSENNSKILSKEDFNSLPFLQEFNSFNDFNNYLDQCCANKTNILGAKIRIKGSFDLTNFLEYFEDYYYYKQNCINDSSNGYFRVYFVNTDLNSNASNIGEVSFIVNRCFYNDNYYEVYGYSYI